MSVDDELEQEKTEYKDVKKSKSIIERTYKADSSIKLLENFMKTRLK